MKRAIINKYMQLEEKLTGYLGMMNFRYLNLCIKAEEVSLLPVKVNIDGSQLNIEDVAIASKKNEYEIMVFPKMEDDLPPTAEAIAKVHPEFKQSIEKMEMEVPNLKFEMEKRMVPYILLTMPEVNDDRRDELENLTNAIHDYTKGQMDTAYANTMAQMAPLLIDESPADVDEIKKALDKLKSDKDEHREKLHAEKLQEINNAYLEWLARYGQDEVDKIEYEDAHNDRVRTSMRFSNSNDEDFNA